MTLVEQVEAETLVAACAEGDLRKEALTRPEVAFSNIEVLQAHSESVANGCESPPAEIGKIKDRSRKTIIDAARTLAIATTLRLLPKCSIRAAALLDYVATRSDNDFGQCVDSAERIADALDCDERTVRRLRDQLAALGALRVDPRPGQSPAIWLPYTSAALTMSANSVLEEIAPPRRSPGRPRKMEMDAETPGAACPGFSEKGWTYPEKTPDMRSENPGHMASTSKNSLSNTSLQGLKGGPVASSVRFAIENRKTDIDGAEHLVRALDAQAIIGVPKGAARRNFVDLLRVSKAIRQLTQEDAMKYAEKLALEDRPGCPTAAALKWHFEEWGPDR